MKLKLLNHNCCLIYSVSKRNETWEGTSWHGYQLVEQIVKIDAGTTWQLAGTRWFKTAKRKHLNKDVYRLFLHVQSKNVYFCQQLDINSTQIQVYSIKINTRVQIAYTADHFDYFTLFIGLSF